MSCADARALLAAAVWLFLPPTADAHGLDDGPSTSTGASAVISPRAELGRKAFFDPLLFSDGSLSCASCHKPDRAFADDVALSKRRRRSRRTRSAPSVMNSTARVSFFWDGRAAVTNQARDEGMFKVPSLRNVAVTAPYMHNGMFYTLRDVLDHYNDP